MLCCSAGMSTNLVVTKMKKAAEEQGKDIEIFAVPVAEADDKFTQGNINCILLGSQVCYMENDLSKK
jgi:cellobiose PTS system EIIB component